MIATNQRPRCQAHCTAAEALAGHKREVDGFLAVIRRHSAGRFGAARGAAHWGHVGVAAAAARHLGETCCFLLGSLPWRAREEPAALDSEQALLAFTQQVEVLLEALAESSDRHFGADLARAHWGDVGSASVPAHRLRELADFLGTAPAASGAAA